MIRIARVSVWGSANGQPNYWCRAWGRNEGRVSNANATQNERELPGRMPTDSGKAHDSATAGHRTRPQLASGQSGLRRRPQFVEPACLGSSDAHSVDKQTYVVELFE